MLQNNSSKEVKIKITSYETGHEMHHTEGRICTSRANFLDETDERLII